MNMDSNAMPKEESFRFTTSNKAKADEIIKRYPEGRQASAVLPLLDLAQRQNGNWLSKEALNYVADYLSLAPIRVYEVASFYTMFNLKPVGENFIQVCRTTPCWLRGSDEIMGICKTELGVGVGETTADGKFTLVEVECLGACVNAPMVQINDDFYEDLTAETMKDLIKTLAKGGKVKVGSQTGRQGSAPLKGALKKGPAHAT